MIISSEAKLNKFEQKRAENIGKKFWLMTVVEYVSRKDGYVFECECGKKSTYKLDRVKRGDVKSCGSCWRKGRPVLAGNEAAKRSVRVRYQMSAKKRGLEFSISEQEIFDLISRDCSYCGSPPSTDMKLSAHPEFRYTGIDRVDNSVGYVSGNCVPCCTICNTSKLYHSEAEWKEWIKRVYTKQFGTFND